MNFETALSVMYGRQKKKWNKREQGNDGKALGNSGMGEGEEGMGAMAERMKWQKKYIYK